MIDKRIIYCWFGKGEISDFAKSCIDSWKEQCPDYEIIEINESNFDVNKYQFTKDAYEHKNYVFVADYARLWALKQMSGFYLDTDIRLIKSLDSLRKYSAIIPMSGKAFYTNGCLGCDEFPEIYQEALDNLKDGRCANELMNDLVFKHYDVYGGDFEVQDNIAFLGNEVFVTPDYSANENTIGIHYACGSWASLWMGSYDKKKTFNAFTVYQDGVRDFGAEKKLFGSVAEESGLDIIGRMDTFGTPVNKTHLFYGNYFFNPKVMTVTGKGFNIQRFDAKNTARKLYVEDVILRCTD